MAQDKRKQKRGGADSKTAPSLPRERRKKPRSRGPYNHRMMQARDK